MSLLSTDPIADMLTRIRNAIAVNKTEVRLPHSKIKQAVAQCLVSSGYLESIEIIDVKPQAEIVITINKSDRPATITEIQRISKPGRRRYSKVDEIPRIKNGRGIVVLSTSKGIMTDSEARLQKLGGELICKVY